MLLKHEAPALASRDETRRLPVLSIVPAGRRVSAPGSLDEVCHEDVSPTDVPPAARCRRGLPHACCLRCAGAEESTARTRAGQLGAERPVDRGQEQLLPARLAEAGGLAEDAVRLP